MIDKMSDRKRQLREKWKWKKRRKELKRKRSEHVNWSEMSFSVYYTGERVSTKLSTALQTDENFIVVYSNRERHKADL